MLNKWNQANGQISRHQTPEGIDAGVAHEAMPIMGDAHLVVVRELPGCYVFSVGMRVLRLSEKALRPCPIIGREHLFENRILKWRGNGFDGRQRGVSGEPGSVQFRMTGGAFAG